VKYIIEFETGDSLTTEDAELAQLHRERGRFVQELPCASSQPAEAAEATPAAQTRTTS
jgi:hypothetical protein